MHSAHLQRPATTVEPPKLQRLRQRLKECARSRDAVIHDPPGVASATARHARPRIVRALCNATQQTHTTSSLYGFGFRHQPHILRIERWARPLRSWRPANPGLRSRRKRACTCQPCACGRLGLSASWTHERASVLIDCMRKGLSSNDQRRQRGDRPCLRSRLVPCSNLAQN